MTHTSVSTDRESKRLICLTLWIVKVVNVLHTQRAHYTVLRISAVKNAWLLNWI